MCNCKGWDVSYHAEYVSIGPHFCRIEGDCGSTDNSIEDAAEKCAEWHEAQAKAWRDGSHPDLQCYREAMDNI